MYGMVPHDSRQASGITNYRQWTDRNEDNDSVILFLEVVVTTNMVEGDREWTWLSFEQPRPTTLKSRKFESTEG